MLTLYSVKYVLLMMLMADKGNHQRDEYSENGINFHIFEPAYTDIISVQNTFWQEKPEFLIANRTLRIWVNDKKLILFKNLIKLSSFSVSKKRSSHFQ